MRLLMSGALRDRLRLWSGLVLFTFALTHFLNHALGLWSLEAMIRAQDLRLAVTRSPAGSALLLAAALTHAGLAFWKLMGLRQFRLQAGEWWQAVTGFAIPFLLARHLFEAGVGPRLLGISAAYPGLLRLIWPAAMISQTALLLVVWTHGVLGLHFWLRSEAWYRRASHLLAALAALVPALALAGAVTAGREATALATTPGPFSDAVAALLSSGAHRAQVAGFVLVALCLAVPALRRWAPASPTRVAVEYLGGPTIASSIGPTLLEISRAHRVPHVSVCGGKARCSTCRVRIVAGGDRLPAPNEAELRLLRRIGAPRDVRLACQLRPTADLTVARLLKPEARRAPAASGFEAVGVEREAAVLFIDIRGFTRLIQAKLAYDIVFILNSFFAAVGQSIEAAGGRVDKYIGDGVMAVFEHPDGLPGAARAALEAVMAVDRELATINRRLADEIAEPLRLAMGLHGGRLVIGRIGWGAAALPTVIGPAVNVASRLESLAKARNVELALSGECAIAAGLAIGSLVIDQVEIRGLDGPFPVVLVASIAELAGARAPD